jgi:hypothetical protein
MEFFFGSNVVETSKMVVKKHPRMGLETSNMEIDSVI